MTSCEHCDVFKISIRENTMLNCGPHRQHSHLKREIWVVCTKIIHLLLLFMFFSTKKTINHSFNETSTKCENLQKIPLATNINKIIGVYTFANKINNSKIMLGKHKTKNKYRYNNKVSTLPLFQFIRCLAFLDALFLLYN
jgi:hypothetical protein